MSENADAGPTTRCHYENGSRVCQLKFGHVGKHFIVKRWIYLAIRRESSD